MRIPLSWLLAVAVVLPLGSREGLRPLNEVSYSQVLAEHRGSVVLVDFWATWCAPCREEMPQIVSLERKYRDKGLRLVTVSCDEAEDQAKAEEFLAKYGTLRLAYLKRVADDEKFITFIDSKWSGALPALFLYDRKGRLARSFIGEADMSALEKAIKNVLL